MVGYLTKNGGLRLLTCLTPTCAESPLIQTIEPDGLNVWGLSMAVINSKVVMSYGAKDVSRAIYWLKVAACTDFSCIALPNVHIVDQMRNGGQTSITGINGLPIIAYLKPGIVMATCLDLYCNYSYATPIAGLNHESPIIRNAANHPVISFLDLEPALGEGNIKLYYGGEFSNDPPITASITPSRTSTALPSPSPTATPFTLPNDATLTAVASLSATITPSITPTPSSTKTLTPTNTFTPTNTPSSTLITPTSPSNATPGPHFFAQRQPTLTWAKVSWSLGYQIQIDDDPTFASPIIADVDASTLTYTTVEELADGLYYWRVRAKESDTEWGDWSATQTIIVSAP